MHGSNGREYRALRLARPPWVEPFAGRQHAGAVSQPLAGFRRPLLQVYIYLPCCAVHWRAQVHREGWGRDQPQCARGSDTLRCRPQPCLTAGAALPYSTPSALGANATAIMVRAMGR